MQRQYNGIPHPAQDNKWDKNTKLKQGQHQDNKIHAESPADADGYLDILTKQSEPKVEDKQKSRRTMTMTECLGMLSNKLMGD